MNSNGTAGPIPIYYRNANPLLYTLAQDHMSIQPYWIMVLEILGFQLLSRSWNYCRCRAFLLSLEFGLIYLILVKQKTYLENALREQNVLFNELSTNSKLFVNGNTQFLSSYLKMTEKKILQYQRKLRFDFVSDVCLVSLPLLGHHIWYCYIQSSCISAEHATVWNCYNAFGYRLFNYSFLSYCNFYYTSAVKTLVLQQAKDSNSPTSKKSMYELFSFYCSNVTFNITYCFGTALFIPYAITHLLPMVAAYAFMTIIYFSLWSAFAFFTTFLLCQTPKLQNSLPLPKILLPKYRSWAGFMYVLAFSCYTYPILLVTSFNYSQYLYYGENYIYTMTNEFNSRDTATYVALFRNSVNERLHSLLNFF